MTGDWSSSELKLEDVALKLRTGEIVPVDLTATAVGAPRFAVLLRLRPSSQRRRLQEREAAEAERLGQLLPP